jgi:phosphate transport system substrate-binding protein
LLRIVGAVAAASALPAAMASVANAATTIQGGGSTLIAPLAAEWQAAYQSSNSSVAFNPYLAKGSGFGLKNIAAGQIDYGGSDAPLSASTVTCNGCHQMPWALTATGVGFHINGLRSLRLTGPVLAQIYLGQIKNWNDHRIQKLQKKGVHLPNLPISVFWRSDGSGDSYAFTDYLSSVSSTFAHQVGRGTLPSFPVGSGANGNSGMVASLASTNGGIAYVAVSYLLAQWPRAAAIKNAAGNYETPNYNNIKDAALYTHLSSVNEVHIVNPPKRYKSAYVVSTYTYVILKDGQPNNGLLKGFISYALGQGQALGPRLDFVPIPGFVKSADQNTLNQVS